jgi:hypothetical protein
VGIETRYRGITYTERHLEEIRALIGTYPDKSRFFLSKQLCHLWNWTQPNGTLKDIVARGLLLFLHRQGLIELPPQKRRLTWLSPEQGIPARIVVDAAPLVRSLAEVVPFTLSMVRRTPDERLYRSLIHQYHYLGYTRPVGEHLEYVAYYDGRPIACSGWCSAPRHIGVRDRYIGWGNEERIANLHKVAVNTRFLILPWVRIPHLASHLLGRIARRIAADWKALYHHEIVWLETFVDPDRGFTGTCYKAANWNYLGLTTGRGKSDQQHQPNRSLKYVFGYPLKKDFRKALYGVL